MGQIVGRAARPDRCNMGQIMQFETPANGEHILVSSDDTMNANFQGNFDSYIVGDGINTAGNLEVKKIDGGVKDYVFGKSAIVYVKNGYILHTYGYYYAQSAYKCVVYDVTPYVGGSVTLGYSARNNIRQYQIVKNYRIIGTSEDPNWSDNLLVAGPQASGTAEDRFNELQVPLTASNVIAQAVVGHVYVIMTVWGTETPTPLVYSKSLDERLAEKQNLLTFDNAPTAGSTNPVTSDGIKSAIAEVDDKTQIVKTITSNDLSFQDYKYYNTHNKTIGSSAPTLASTQSPYDVGAATMEMKKGHTYVVSSKSNTSSDYGRPVCFVENGLIVAMATYNDAITTPFTYKAENDGMIYVTCEISRYSEFYIKDSIPIAEYVESLEPSQDVTEFPLVFLPSKIYGVVGETQQLFYRGIVRKRNPYDIFLHFGASGFKSRNRYVETTPSAVGNTQISAKLINDKYEESDVVSSQFVVKATPSASSSINVLCLGDSTTGNSYCFPIELKRRLCDTGGSPAGLGLSAISFVGRKNVMGSSVKCEGNGGWTWGSFTSQGTQKIRFVLTNAQTGSIGAIYSFVSSSGAVQVRLAEWNVTEGSGNALFEYVNSSDAGKTPTTTSGTLTYVSGGEYTDNLSFTSYEVEASNPFWYNGSLDIQHYADTYCDGKIDVLICNFFATFNNGIVGKDSVASVVAQMKTFIDAYHAAFPNGKVILNSTQPPSQYYGIEYNYGNLNVRNTWSVLWNCFEWSMALNDFCNNSSYSSFCYYSNSLAEVDSEYAYPTTEVDVDTRVTDKKELLGTNGVHTSSTGSKMTADAIFRCFVCNVFN